MYWLLAMLMFSALSVKAETYGDFTYTIANETVTITDYSTSSDPLIFPSKINGLPVTRIESMPGPREPINQNVTSIVIPSSVTTLGNYAFYWLTQLPTIYIPASVTNIEELALVGLRGLIHFNVDQNNPNYCSQDGVLYSKAKDKLLRYPWGKSGSSFVIPGEVTEIAPGAFSGSDLETISIPASVQSVGLCLLGPNGDYMPALTSVNVDEANSYYSSQDGVLFNKNKSTLIFYPMNKSGSSYTIPNGINHIGKCAFAYGRKLTNITIPQSVTGIGSEAFALSGLMNISIPDNVTNIETGAFEGCWSLETVTLPSNITTIKENAFAGCNSLKTIVIPSNVTAIENGAFQSCGSLSAIQLPNGLQSIGEYAFLNCGSLQAIKIPASVITIGDCAFGCPNLKAVIFLGNAPEFAGEVFSGPGSTSSNSSLTTVYYISGTTGWGATYSGRPTAVWVVQPPIISIFSALGVNSKKLNHNTSPGVPYRVETSSDLKNWTTFSSGWGDGETREYQENSPGQPNLPQSDRMFYRLVQENP